MNLKVQEFASFVREKVNSSGNQRQAIAAILGVSIGLSLNVPTSQTEHIPSAWDRSQANVADRYISVFNEAAPMDIDVAREIARAIWMTRATAAQPESLLIVSPKGESSFMEKLFGYEQYLGKNYQDYLENNKEIFLVCINRARGLIPTIDIS
jgi:hypothetical protein